MRLNIFRKISILAVMGALVFSVPGPVYSSEIMDGMKETIDDILLTIKKEQIKDVRRDKIKEIVNRKFDYVEMAKRALAKNWNSRTPEERREFTDVFGELLRRTYITKIEKYTDERVDFIEEKVGKKGRAIVKTLIIKKEDSIPVDYRLIKKDGKWYCYDFVIENVSLIRNYRSQFGRIIKDSSYNDLLTRMKNKIHALREQDSKAEEPVEANQTVEEI